jgi:hypothetical protein
MKRNEEDEILPANLVGKIYENEYDKRLIEKTEEYRKRCSKAIREAAQYGKKWCSVWSPLIGEDLLKKIIPVVCEELISKGYKITRDECYYIKVQWE